MKNKVLYWPGRGNNLKVLEIFRAVLAKKINSIKIVDVLYDTGELSPQCWNCVSDNTYGWWIGISLGASLCFYSLQYTSKLPSRVTLINPFFSRKELSVEKNFSLKNQWNFSLEDRLSFSSNLDIDLDIVVSIHDDKIPFHHIFDILMRYNTKSTRLIFINSDHAISNDLAQIELVEVLMGDKKNEKNYYCYICEQK